jgi:pimeloyl-ACP methyl ester carboxylesterase
LLLSLDASPLAPGQSPVRIHYRDAGAGSPLVFLHSGWGHAIYPFDRQVDGLAHEHRIIIPDRSGYGQSTPIETMPIDFHARAMEETRSVLDALALQQPIVWGHSDGAIIALLLALAAPERVAAVIVEATHFYRKKPRSRPFFEALIANPRSVGPTTSSLLETDHGADWPRVIARHSLTWRQIADEAASESEDFYGGRLGEIAVPVLMIHGARDPRTEPGEIDALRSALEQRPGGPRRQVIVLPDGGHSPHSERSTADDVNRIARQFVHR